MRTICVFSENEGHVRRLLGALGKTDEVKVARSWGELLLAAGGCRCSVVLIEWLVGSQEPQRLRSLHTRFPAHPVVLVTREDADNARCLSGVGVVEVLWLREIESRLAAAVARACAVGSVARLATVLERAERLPEKLRCALRDACLAQHTPRTVCRLAANAGCHRSTLWTQWRKAMAGEAGSPGLRLEDVLDWLLLLSAVERKSPELKWVDVAYDLGVHEHTVVRMARRLTGCALRELENGGHAKLLEHFTTRVLPYIVGHA